MSDSAAPLQVAILALPEVTASVVYGLYDLFLSAGRDWGLIVEGRPGPSLLRPVVVAHHSGLLEVANGATIKAEAGLEDGEPYPVVCVPEVAIPPGEPLRGRFEPEVAWLRRCHAAGAMLATSCSGALLLAEAGLLDGCEATTHWAYCDILARDYPDVVVRRERTLVMSGDGQRLVMAGGGTSWLDLALYVIARTVGIEHAMNAARVNLIDWHDVGQQPFARLARSRQSADAVIARCQTWIADHYQEPAPVAAMVRLSGLPERSFKRRFREATGLAPLEYVHTLRLEEAKHMLEAGTEAIESIANAVGYEDAGFFSRLFRRSVNMTPAQYRKRFGAMRTALQSARAQPPWEHARPRA